jgi:sugar phosphate isomerase/epimerase
MRLGLQLYTLRNLDESLVETIERVGTTAYEGVQFSRLGDADVDALATALEAAGLATAGAHVDLDALTDDPAAVLDSYRTLDCSELVVPSYDESAFETAAGARDAGARLAELADRLAGDGVGLHYHNHTFEFTPLGDDGTRAYDEFAAAADGVGLEVDTGLANHAGVDPVALLERHADRLSLVHLTDSRPDDEDALHVDIGEGTVDVEACVDAAAAAGADWLLFEHGLTDDPPGSIERAADRLAPLP